MPTLPLQVMEARETRELGRYRLQGLQPGKITETELRNPLKQV